jgi:glycerol-3-phosphate dehydrogenase
MSADRVFDLAIVGAGINGAGIARDAAGRGLRVLIVEKDDIAAHTSSASSKFIHGGLRYLEQYEFRLVAEALAERRILLAAAPHLVRPMTFVLPHEAHLRPMWMIRLGLGFYDLFGARGPLHRARGVDLRASPYGAPLKTTFTRGFTYADAWVDDARLAVANVRDAADRGADVRIGTRCAGARRDGDAWSLRLVAHDGDERTERARLLVNAAGPWAQHFIETELRAPARGRLRLVKGSHIAVPRLYEGDHAYILQNPDRRVIFLFPYGEDLTAIGTTDIPVEDSDYTPRISTAEIEYLCAAASRYTARAIEPRDVVNTWSGVRALYDDGAANPSEVTREYRLLLDAGGPPLLSVFGGKLTTYRRLAERALDQIARYFPAMGRPWTHRATLPGGDFGGRPFDTVAAATIGRYPAFDPAWLTRLLRRHGSLLPEVLGDALATADLGERFAPGLYEREVRYLLEREWARTADDILWRRTKAGLRASADDATRLAAFVASAVEA